MYTTLQVLSKWLNVISRKILYQWQIIGFYHLKKHSGSPEKAYLFQLNNCRLI
jgi:hypothetical protein